jgi:hypothetical protein
MSSSHKLAPSHELWQQRLGAYESPLINRVRTIAKGAMLAHGQPSGLVLYGEAVREIAAGRRPGEHSFAFFGLEINQVIKLLHFYFPELLIVHEHEDGVRISAKMAKRDALTFAVPNCAMAEFVTKQYSLQLNSAVYDLGRHTLSVTDSVFSQLEEGVCELQSKSHVTTNGLLEGLKLVSRHGLKFNDQALDGFKALLNNQEGALSPEQLNDSLIDVLGCSYFPEQTFALCESLNLLPAWFPESEFINSGIRTRGSELILRLREKSISAHIGLRDEQFMSLALALLFVFARTKMDGERLSRLPGDWRIPVDQLAVRLALPARVVSGVQSAVTCTDQLLKVLDSSTPKEESSDPAPVSRGSGIGRGGFVARSSQPARQEVKHSSKPIAEQVNDAIQAVPSFSPAMAALLVDTLLDKSSNFPATQKAETILKASEEQKSNQPKKPPLNSASSPRSEKASPPRQHSQLNQRGSDAKQHNPQRGSQNSPPAKAGRPGMGPRLQLKKR